MGFLLPLDAWNRLRHLHIILQNIQCNESGGVGIASLLTK